MEINGSVALVTGGASGLGLATATFLAAAGASVTVADLHEPVAPLPAGCAFVSCDVTSPDSVAAAVSAAGPVRVLVNCPGIATPGRVVGRSGPLALSTFASVVGVNLIGTFNVIRLAASVMAGLDAVEGERGVIINTASIAAFDGQIGQAAYAASKAGVVGMTLPLARDLAASLIRVMTIAPGLFQTPMLSVLPDEAIAALGAAVPHPARLGVPSEYAALAGHIITNQMLNGEVIRLDGAIRMAPR